jgi:hypothetical protein
MEDFQFSSATFQNNSLFGDEPIGGCFKFSNFFSLFGVHFSKKRGKGERLKREFVYFSTFLVNSQFSGERKTFWVISRSSTFSYF